MESLKKTRFSLDNNLPKAFVFGDTSSFHLGSSENYTNFRNELNKRYQIVGELKYNHFFNDIDSQRDYDVFRQRLTQSGLLQKITDCSVIVVHAEGLLECWRIVGLPYMYFGRLAKEHGIEAWLVNFSMFKVEPYYHYLKDFSFIASRDPITLDRLSKFGIQARLTFDCCCLSFDAPAETTELDERIALIRGRNVEVFEPWLSQVDTLKYDCAWRWRRNRGTLSWFIFGVLKRVGLDFSVGVSSKNLADCIQQLSKHRFSMTTSYHGNIFSFLAGIPFVALDLNSNEKYRATIVDLLPEHFKSISPDTVLKDNFDELLWRKQVQSHYRKIFPQLKKRALGNIRNYEDTGDIIGDPIPTEQKTT